MSKSELVIQELSIRHGALKIEYSALSIEH